MAINITRNAEGNCITFVGSTNPAYWNACLSAEINSEDADRINIINDLRSAGGADQYEFYAVEYTAFADKNGVAFSSAQDCVDYINLNANVTSLSGVVIEPTDTLNFTLDVTDSSVISSEGNAYFINQLQAVANGTYIDIVNRHGATTKYYQQVPVSSLQIDGVAVNSVLATAVTQLNNLFTSTTSFISSGGATVDSGSVSGNTLTLTLSDSSTVDVDVTTLAVDENSYVVSGALSGTDLVLTMSDSSTVTIDITNLLTGSGEADDTKQPNVSNQSFDITESTSVNITPALDANSNIATIYNYTNLPSWLVANQSTGQLLGTAPAHSGGVGDDVITFTVTVGNPFGIDSATITLNIQDQVYTNTKSMEFNGSQYLSSNPSLTTMFERANNGTGASDAWTVSMWYKMGATASSGRTMFYYGNSGQGYIEMRQTNTNRLRFSYGSNTNYLRFTESSSGANVAGQWVNYIITYNGGTTGAGSADINNYYGRFRVFKDGVEITSGTTGWTNSNYGWSSGITGNDFRIGRFASGNYLNGGDKIDELALWGSDQSSNVSDIYNGGVTHDLSLLTTAPDNYYRMGDAVTDTSSAIDNVMSSVNDQMLMNNMTVSNIVTDAP